MAGPKTQMWSWALCVLLSCLCGACASHGPHYLVSIPAILEADADTQLCMTLLKPNESLTFTATLRSQNQNLTIVKEISTLDFQNCIGFRVPPGDDEVVYLDVEVQGETFHSKEVRKVLIRTYKPLTFVQTDKPIYAPGQTVFFRVVTLDTKFRPAAQLYDSIYIEDSDNNKLEQWLNETSDGKILQLSFDLNAQVEEGKYKLIVSTGGEEIYQFFRVEKYVLPKFEVLIEASDEVSIGQEEIKVDVCAKYPFNQPVPSSISAELCRPLNFHASFKGIDTPCFTMIQKADKSGCGQFVFETSTFKRLDEQLLQNSLLFNTKVTEEGTGISYQEEKKISITLVVATLTFVETPKLYQSGSDVVGKVKAVCYNDTPIADLPVYLFDGDHLIQNLTTDSEGLAEFNYSTFDSTGDITLQASAKPELRKPYSFPKDVYIKQGKHILSVQDDSPVSPTVSSLEVEQKLETIPCDTDEEVSVKYTIVGEPDGSADAFYLILARGAIVKQGHGKIEVSDQPVTEGELTVKLKVSPDMAPIVQLVVYAILPSGAVIAQSAEFPTEKCYNNKVSLDFSPSSAVSGEENTLQLTALPDSLCGVFVVDQSVLKKDSRRILDDKRIFDLLPIITINNIPPVIKEEEKCLPVRPKRHILPSIEPKDDAYTVFKDVGLKVATNLQIKIPTCLQYGEREYTYNPDTEDASLPRPNGWTDLSEPTEKVPFFFPDTWLWDLVEIGESGAKNLSVSVPHNITTWETEAFCLSPQGFGLAPRETLDVSQPFSLELKLPYSVIQGENFELKATVYNYLSGCIMVSVTPVASLDYGLERKPDEEYETCLCGGERKTFGWTLTPKTIGNLEVSVSAEAVASHVTCDNEAVIVPERGNIDTVVKHFKVKAEGVKRQKTFNWLLCPKDEALTAVVDIDVPEDVIEGSSSVYVSALGDIPSRVLQNVGGLLHMPYGNGESNLAVLAPNIYLLQYMESTNQLTPEIRKKLINNLSSSYQRQLKYTHFSGAFSTFESGSENTWLTASVLKSFNKAKDYIFIDQGVIDRAKEWLDRNQQRSGCFSQSGKFFNNAVKGNVSDDVIITAYVTAAFLEANRTVTSSIAKSLLCLNKTTYDLSNTYATALQAYTFTLAGDTETRNRLLNQLGNVAIKEGPYVHWSQSGADTSYSLDVEMTAYVLLALISGSPTKEELDGASQIVRWLIKQQNYYGGFFSTQDTLVALQALDLYSSLVFTPEGSSSVSVDSPGSHLDFEINQDKLQYQEQTLKDVAGNYKVEVKGACAAVQISHHYNIPPPIVRATLELLVTTSSSCVGSPYRPTMTIHVKGLYIGDKYLSNMVILDFKVLSGFIPDPESIKELEGDPRVEQVDHFNDHVVVYIKEFSWGSILQYQLKIIQEIPVSDLKPAVVKLYDYFQPSNIGQGSYIYPCLAD